MDAAESASCAHAPHATVAQRGRWANLFAEVRVEPMDERGRLGRARPPPSRRRHDVGREASGDRRVVRERQRALGMYEREARFYRELAALLNVRTPQLLLRVGRPAPARRRRARGRGDLPRRTPCRSASTLSSTTSSRCTVRGRRAGALEDLPWLWRVDADEADRWQHHLEERLPRFIDRHRAQLTAADVDVAEAVTALARSGDARPQRTSPRRCATATRAPRT